jgi:flagellin
MAFSIQTNVNALIAQENLRVGGDFQSRTIQRLTSGYRINQSGDDAAGLAIANKFRSDIAELMQGVRNANDGVAQLQIIDGGMNNISKMLDRLKTLATQSASSTYTGDRTVLNKEYQTLVGEIDRQAQSVGLATGGRFATKMGVFIGGGATNSGAVDTANGTVQLDFTSSVVDTKGLGLRTSSFQAASGTGTDIGSGSVTSVSAILADSQNTTTATFNFTGPNFASLSVGVDLSGVTDTNATVSRINDAIALASNAGTSAANAFRDAGIQASVITDPNGAQRLAFSSTSAAFQVSAGSKAANALMGNFKTAGLAEGKDVAATVTGATTVSAVAPGGATNVAMHVVGVDGTESNVTVALVAADDTRAEKLAKVNTALSGTGITASLSSNKLVFTAGAGESFQIAVGNDANNFLGLGAWQGNFATNAYTGTVDITGSLGAGQTSTYEFSVNGGKSIAVQVRADTVAHAQADLQQAFDNNVTLAAAGLRAQVNGGGTGIDVDSTSTTNFRMNFSAGTDLELSGAAAVAAAGSLTASYVGMSANDVTTDAGSTSATGLGSGADVIAFAGMRNTGDSQEISVSTKDDTGSTQAVSITLSAANAGNIDAAVDAINTQLLTNTSLKNIVAVKELNNAGTAEGIRFIGSSASFSVKIGSATNYTAANPVGLYDGTAGASHVQGFTTDSSQSGVVDISTIGGAQQAVVALGSAVLKLGVSQAAIGKGQNQLGYAVNLAQSQITNFSGAESRIRDADIASEAANLTKAQVLQQASMAAMAQANSAPQAVLALLRG